MAQYIAFDRNVEVSGKIVCALFEAAYANEKAFCEIVTKYGLDRPDADEWYNLQNYLNAINEIAKLYGPNLLFCVGKSIAGSIRFLAKNHSLETALAHLNDSIQNYHRGGETGYYKLLSFSSEKKEAQIECKNPYPCYLDRGILTAVCRDYRPSNSKVVHIELDTSRPNRLAGGHVSYYNIIWD